MTADDVVNKVAAVNAPIAPRLDFGLTWRRVTEQRRSPL